MPTMTSSFRIDLELNERLNTTAKLLKKNKNWIIKQAVEEYLNRMNLDEFQKEARRQSLLVSAHPTETERAWLESTDFSGWK